MTVNQPIEYTCFQMMAKQKRHTLGMAFVGLGLILVGAVSLTLASTAASAPPLGVIPAQVSYSAPALELNDLDGKHVSLDGFRGQVVLVNLWGTWCPPCKEEMPVLQAFYTRHNEEGFTIIAINDGESAPDVRRFVASYRLTFPVWLDPEYVATEKAFQTLNLPSSFVIDRAAGSVYAGWAALVSQRWKSM